MQINRGNDAERHHHNRHQDHHQHRAKNGREYAAFGVGLTWAVSKEFLDLLAPVHQLLGGIHRIGIPGIAHLAKRNSMNLAVHITQQQRITVTIAVQAFQSVRQQPILTLQFQSLSVDGRLRTGVELVVMLQAFLPQAQRIKPLVDTRHIAELNIMRLTGKRGNLRQTLQQRLAEITPGQRLAVLQHARQITISGAITVAFQYQQIARRTLAKNVTGQQRAEVLPFAVTITHFDQIALKTLRISWRQGNSGLL
ncbi:hypothetical protein D3C75_888090 [compost metagenome]